MQGTIVKIAVEEGQQVEPGDLVVVLEAMKMEQPITAHKAGTVTGLPAEVGQAGGVVPGGGFVGVDADGGIDGRVALGQGDGGAAVVQVGGDGDQRGDTGGEGAGDDLVAVGVVALVVQVEVGVCDHTRLRPPAGGSGRPTSGGSGTRFISCSAAEPCAGAR